MHMKKTLLAAAAVTALFSTAARADIAVATAGPITGQYASFGEQMKKGMEMAVADINAAGGLLGEKLKLEVGDDACDPKQAVAVANQLAKAGVKFVAGHFCSGSSIPASQVYNEEGILQMSPASTNPKLTEQGLKNVFRVCGRDDQQGMIAGQYLANTYKGKNIAILHDKSAYGKGLADETQKALNAAGLKEKVYEAYTAGEKDYSALVSKLKQEAVDVVYVGGYHTEAGLIARQMKDQGMTAPIVSGDALVTNEYWAITGAAGEGTMMTFGPDPREKAEAKAVVEKFRKAGYEPEGYTLYTYAAMQIYAAAVTEAKSTDMAKVAAVLGKKQFDTVIGKIGFDAKGDVTSPAYVWYKWANGQYAEVK
ncbi:branched-chain amino acid ABC transporter substrate-binding protein [Azospirillum sp. RWY-5-1]|uniref:Branched-chain amino acid ABC transporter substrate-binding protein n=1 Tax=Azospirillum oleiclasticum TaxID=2735135 RepID=A0ABX2T3N2_9PROT|nr:branched-chain amino acid ABC transporter substrate-binding protein [Azospirillum oleiclasticum]NYZ11707.1 branched-chain amino acid ABC transporter substrate-binding protein [Azospirillum oleiclasticum]NYZ18868.1 branched-chain amino acid ABC transporter substrate-binding protein [Azospirillum oleiclasticum]